MGTRLYAVTACCGDEQRDYLIDATTKNTAASYVAAKHIKAQIADGKAVAALMAKGVAPESADQIPLPIE